MEWVVVLSTAELAGCAVRVSTSAYPLQSHTLSIESEPSGSWVLAGSDTLFMDACMQSLRASIIQHHSNRVDMVTGLARLRRRGTQR